MALSHLLDTSVLTRLRSPEVRARVSALATSRSCSRTRLSDLEIGFSARNGAEWLELQGAVSAFAEAPIGEGVFHRALVVQRLLAGRGLRGRKVPDLLIAATAELLGLTVLHYDADFDHIGSVTGQPTEWVVPAGSIP